MKAVSKTGKNEYTIQKDVNGRWFGYCDQTKEYTPAFISLTGLKRLMELKGYEIVEEERNYEE